MRRRPLLVSVALACTLAVTGCSGASSGPARTSAVVFSPRATTPTATTPAATSATAGRSVRPSASSSHSSHSATPARTPSPTPPARGRSKANALPLRYSTGNATQLITVVASSGSSTTATLQRWSRGPQGWTRVGPSVPAYLGDAGIGQASESTDTTPTGSYTLTQAFGRNSDPGTALPYTQTTPDDWWVSQPGPLYNTRQRCASGCSFTHGAPNEHLYYETPFYRYAVVIDYNTRNAPGGVRPGAGSAFFLHVTVHEPTQGCVSIDEDQLVRVLRWLDPARHPRIMLGIR